MWLMTHVIEVLSIKGHNQGNDHTDRNGCPAWFTFHKMPFWGRSSTIQRVPQYMIAPVVTTVSDVEADFGLLAHHVVRKLGEYNALRMISKEHPQVP